jgi:hypothetical protein
MEFKISKVSAISCQPRWLLFVIEQQHLAIGAEGIEAVYRSCLPQHPQRFSAFLSAELHEGQPVFMRPLTELFRLADPHYFAANEPRAWCLVTRGADQTRLGCWVDEVTGPITASASMGQIVHAQRTYLTASLVEPTRSTTP